MEHRLFFGKPENYKYDTILDQFSGSKINSIRTSSVPLVQYWQKTDKRIQSLVENIEVNSNKFELCFEYPTESLGRSKSSMTDLMLLSGNAKIALEAKFTEYAKSSSDLIKKWQTAGNIENRKQVLSHWQDLIEGFTYGIDQKNFSEISYQFLHRTASACKNSKEAIVIYQLFYDDKTRDYLDYYKKSLKKYADIINPNDKLSFFTWDVKTNQLYQEQEISDPFIKMKSEKIYEFQIERIEPM